METPGVAEGNEDKLPPLRQMLGQQTLRRRFRLIFELRQDTCLILRRRFLVEGVDLRAFCDGGLQTHGTDDQLHGRAGCLRVPSGQTTASFHEQNQGHTEAAGQRCVLHGSCTASHGCVLPLKTGSQVCAVSDGSMCNRRSTPPVHETGSFVPWKVMAADMETVFRG